MSTAVNAALAANASVQASVAAQQAHEANVTACMGYMSTFQGRGASVEEARQYSQCVSTVYPSTDFDIEIPGKALVSTCLLAVLLAILFGLYKRKQDRGWVDTSWFEILIIYPIGGCVIWGAGWGVYAAIVYLLS